MHAIDVITISREFGAGGGLLASVLGERLGWRVVDRDLARAVAARLGVPMEAVEARDEHAPGLLERIGTSVLRTSPELVPAPEAVRLPDPAAVAAAVRGVLLDAAKSPPLVIVGHGSQSLFHGRPGTLHVRLIAPLDARVRRICARSGCTEKVAAALAQRMDADRASYVRRYFGRDWRDPLLYDVQLNTGSLGLEESAQLILAIVAGRRAEPDRAPAAAGAGAERGA